MRSNLLTLFITSLLIVVAIQACDVAGEESYNWKPGDSLTIVGPQEVTVGDTASYYVRAFTIDKQYSWTVNGNEVESYRDGEFIDFIFSEAGTYTIAVDDNEEYTGELEVEATAASD